MSSKERREKILNKLTSTEEAIKGTNLAKTLNVTRQVIVQDIALLRAQGENIIATPQGYIMLTTKENRIRKRIACKHEGYNSIEDELQTMIDYGATIVDVIVEHSLYGEIASMLNISNKIDLKDFINKITQKNAEPLSTLTDGVHIHTIEIDSEENFQQMKKALMKKGYLINE